MIYIYTYIYIYCQVLAICLIDTGTAQYSYFIPPIFYHYFKATLLNITDAELSHSLSMVEQMSRLNDIRFLWMILYLATTAIE